ncbi:hypothetical protein BJ742DRAFT_776344 [Cladochytrium replicatum]|nr:hypothetical protein BJ742DRAFT_776344 [Cladochytrium replicatum]
MAATSKTSQSVAWDSKVHCTGTDDEHVVEFPRSRGGRAERLPPWMIRELAFDAPSATLLLLSTTMVYRLYRESSRIQGAASFLCIPRKKGRLKGVERLEIIRDQAKVRALEPNIHPDVVWALLCPDAGAVSLYLYTTLLAENAIMNDVEFRTEHKALDIQRTAHAGIRVKSDRGDLIVEPKM